MKYNLAPESLIRNISGPYTRATEDELELLSDGDKSSSGISVSSETYAFICDLGARYRLDELKYYRESADSENISFFGRQGKGSSYPWEEITHQDKGDHLFADLSILKDKYEFIKIVHTVVSGNGVIYELEIWSSDEEIKFGSSGETTIFSVDSGTDLRLPEKISLFNPDNISHTFYCLLEGSDVESESVGIGHTSSGTFTKLYESGLSLPDDFPWSSGSFDNTVEDNNTIVLVSGTSGTYYTPVIDIDSLEGRRLFWKATLSGSSEIDLASVSGSVPVIGSRFSDEAPSDVGWSTGQLSNDSNWDIDTGSLDFEPYNNDQILNPDYKKYFQAKVEFSSPIDGETPVLEKVGIEEGLKVVVPPNKSESIFARSFFEDQKNERETEIVVWYFESRNEEQ